MPAQDTVEVEEHAPEKEAKGGLQDMMIRMAMGVAVNLIARKVRQHQKRKKAMRKAAKLIRKGKKIPPDLKADMVKGLSRRARRKLVEKAEWKVATVKNKKAEKREKAKKKGEIRKLLRLVVLVAAVVLVVRLVKSQQEAARSGAALSQMLYDMVQ